MPNMQRIQNFTGQARQGWEKMTPSMPFGTSRSHNDMNGPPSMKGNMPANSAASPEPPAILPNAFVHLSFNVPFASHLGGPDPEEIVHATDGAFGRWTHHQDTPEGAPNHRLPVHTQHVDNLRMTCRQLSEMGMQASVVSAQPKPIPGLQRGPLQAMVTNVILSGEYQHVKNTRGQILAESPISLRTTVVDIGRDLVMDSTGNTIRDQFIASLEDTARRTKADIFLLHPKPIDDSSSFNGPLEVLDQRLRIAIYGDMEALEHAKMLLLIRIDQWLGRAVDSMELELSMHTLVCGRARKNIQLIESSTNTAIYFPPPFPRIYRYSPPGAQPRNDDEIFITGENRDDILKAKKKLHDLIVETKVYVKDTKITVTKMDSLLLERLDKIQNIIEAYGSHLILPHLGLQAEKIRVQGLAVLHVERTMREIQVLAGQFYSASWSVTQPSQREPTPDEVRAMLSDICINSGAEISVDGLTFHINGSDEAVKAAMLVMYEIPFIKKSQYTMRVRVELGNEHKEFVSGKKNGKINKIMGSSQVQILFHQFNEYNFYINVQGNQYEHVHHGLEQVEAEMPASIQFHVPDQYHKRIIGIGGAHIQRIMKRYSVFVKFSNAMDRGGGGMGKEDEDLKVDNVICRTPSRNAASLDLVKQEIMEMVEKQDAEVVVERVPVNRLFHRQLIARMPEIEGLEKKWNCKISFPSTEQASDLVTVSGPEYQVPHAMEEFLAMVPECHEIAFPSTAELSAYLRSEECRTDVLQKLKEVYMVEASINTPVSSPDATDEPHEVLKLKYTLNNAGGIKDAIDFLVTRLVARGLDGSTVRGAIQRPKSDSFEESLPFFDSKLLQRSSATDSPTRSQFGDDQQNERTSFMDRLRKPGSMSSFASLLDRRKNGSNSPGSLFKHASSNASKASLVSLESQGSYRNPWNDSGINLTDEDPHSIHHHNHLGHTSTPWNAPPHAAAAAARFEAASGVPSSSAPKFALGFPTSNISVTSLTAGPVISVPGDITPRYEQTTRASFDSGRPSTSHSASNGYPGPIGPSR